MARMTEEEADALDELWTKTTPKISGDGKNGFFMKHKDHIIIVADVSAAYLRARADANHKTPGEIIGDLIREKIAASAKAPRTSARAEPMAPPRSFVARCLRGHYHLPGSNPSGGGIRCTDSPVSSST